MEGCFMFQWGGGVLFQMRGTSFLSGWGGTHGGHWFWWGGFREKS